MALVGRVGSFTARATTLRQVLWTIIFALALAFLTLLIGQHYDGLAAALAHASVGKVSASIVILLASNLGAAMIFSELTRKEVGGPSTPLRGAGIFLASQVGKYVPGRIWSVVLQRKLLSGGVHWVGLGIVNAEMALLTVTCSLGAAIACIAWYMYGEITFLLAVVATVLLIYQIAESRFLRRWAHQILRLFPSKRAQRALDSADMVENPEGRRRMRFGAVLYGVLLVPGWLLFLSGFGIPVEQGRPLVALLAISSLAGVVSLMPGGLGVREGVILAFGSGVSANAELLAMVAVSTRVAILVLDALSFPLGICLMKLESKNGTK